MHAASRKHKVRPSCWGWREVAEVPVLNSIPSTHIRARYHFNSYSRASDFFQPLQTMSVCGTQPYMQTRLPFAHKAEIKE